MSEYYEHIAQEWPLFTKFTGERIMRCRDCIYYELDPDPIDPGWPMMCERTGQDMVEPYGFCAWGVRKDD